jgi:hypothetical protein
MNKEEAEFFKWCGVVERDSNIDIAGLRTAGMHQRFTERLIQKFPSLKENKTFSKDREGNLREIPKEETLKNSKEEISKDKPKEDKKEPLKFRFRRN